VLPAQTGADASGGTLVLKGHVSTRGRVPRNFKLCGSAGQWLVVGNQVTSATRRRRLRKHGSGKSQPRERHARRPRWRVTREQESRTVCSFRIDAATGMPEFASEVSTGDAKPCNIAPLP
jgi:6-phosphogluconolactonase (cycloisomerase 2 family)